MAEKPIEVLRRMQERRAAVEATAATVTKAALDAAERERVNPETTVSLEAK